MPFIGFYGNGEIGPLKNANHIYSYSASLGLFKLRQ
jgi:small ligand-binding sensory domain FIST